MMLLTIGGCDAECGGILGDCPDEWVCLSGRCDEPCRTTDECGEDQECWRGGCRHAGASSPPWMNDDSASLWGAWVEREGTDAECCVAMRFTDDGFAYRHGVRSPRGLWGGGGGVQLHSPSP